MGMYADDAVLMSTNKDMEQLEIEATKLHCFQKEKIKQLIMRTYNSNVLGLSGFEATDSTKYLVKVYDENLLDLSYWRFVLVSEHHCFPMKNMRYSRTKYKLGEPRKVDLRKSMPILLLKW